MQSAPALCIGCVRDIGGNPPILKRTRMPRNRTGQIIQSPIGGSNDGADVHTMFYTILYYAINNSHTTSAATHAKGTGQYLWIALKITYPRPASV